MAVTAELLISNVGIQDFRPTFLDVETRPKVISWRKERNAHIEWMRELSAHVNANDPYRVHCKVRPLFVGFRTGGR